MIETLLKQLIAYPSVTPHDAGCQDFLIDYLENLGFVCERMNNAPVSNFFARFGDTEPLLIFAGHTDVVPVGNTLKWLTDPFVLSNQAGMLYGRGVADMKGSIASMLVAATFFTKAHPKPRGSLGLLITSGEEGDLYHQGTPHVMAALLAQGIKPTYCIVGEPSSQARLGDMIKIGRRGSLSARITLHGKQGHVAYPHLAENPIHTISPALNELVHTTWDNGNAHFPPTTLQITHIQAGGGAENIIPGELRLDLNTRFSTEQTAEGLMQAVEACFKRHGLSPDITWHLNGEPFLTAKGALLDACIETIQAQTGYAPELSTSGGTSDGRFIAPHGIETIELGPVNASIHQVNESVSLADLEQLAKLYFSISERLLG